MKKKKRETRFVIFAEHEQHGGPGTHYISKEGAPTTYLHEAARFHSFTDAEDFAKRHNIKLTAVTYIGREAFSVFELQERSDELFEGAYLEFARRSAATLRTTEGDR